MQAQAMAMAPQLAMRPSGVLVAAMELLAMPSVELDQLVDRELAANPALERSERPLCPLCGAELAAERCAACRRERRDGVAPAPPELALQAEPTLAETLRAEVHLQLAQCDRPIAEYLLGCLDEHGFIDAEVDDVAATLRVTRERVTAVVRTIQQAGPPGVGARDVGECLLLQLAHAAGDARHRELARVVVGGRHDREAWFARDARESFPRTVATLAELVSFPSVSAQPARAADVAACAAWLADRLRRIGLADARVVATRGHPVVCASWRGLGERPTLLVYGHYDVQPAEPLRAWRSPPFAPAVRGDALYGRGASDDKGQLLAHVAAIEAYLRTCRELPVNVTCLFEGEEEIGSPSLTPLLREHRDARGRRRRRVGHADARPAAPGDHCSAPTGRGCTPGSSSPRCGCSAWRRAPSASCSAETCCDSSPGPGAAAVRHRRT